MKPLLLSLALAGSLTLHAQKAATPTERDVPSPTEGVITHRFVPEAEMMEGLLRMLARFGEYMANDFFDAQHPNSLGEPCGFFLGESSGQANEAGVRTNADLSMLCAFLVKYAKPAGVDLPEGVTWERIEEMARKSLVFAYSTHKANRLKVCAGSVPYWGSTSVADHVWESSLWAMSVAYSAYFQWDSLSLEQKGYIYQLLKAECDYELERTIPTGYISDTKAEENGWEADVLAATLGLFPDDEMAPRWFQRLRQFAVNSYSHPRDASDQTVIDPDYDSATVADLYQGPNLYPDYTLQNHDLFHTSYQNVVIQELGEAALALHLFQGPNPKWKTRALTHNCQAVTDSVLNWLALADGELAMPNGNDWSLFLFDQITSYATMACLLRDPNALLLENLAYQHIQARQRTTPDGAWLLRPDVGARRMGVQGHRVMMTYLMHLTHSTTDLQPTAWEDFRAAHCQARMLPDQNIVRAFTRDRFTTFSWSQGLKSYTGYFAGNTPDKNKIVVPFRAHNTGNLLGWYTVEGKRTNATPVVSGIYDLQGDAYTMNGELNTNDQSLNHRFALYSTPGNALIYLDHVQALTDGVLTGEYGGLVAISTDEFTRPRRTLYAEGTHRQSDGDSLTTFASDWVNVDNEVGIVGRNGKVIAFGHRSANNSIYTAKLYPMHRTESRPFRKDSLVDRRHLVYYCQVDAATTARLCQTLQPLADQLPAGWNGLLAADPDSTHYLLLANFRSEEHEATVSALQVDGMAPVFPEPTCIKTNRSTATFTLQPNHSAGRVIRFRVAGDGLNARQVSDSALTIQAQKSGKVKIKVGHNVTNLRIKKGQTLLIQQKADYSLSKSKM